MSVPDWPAGDFRARLEATRDLVTKGISLLIDEALAVNETLSRARNDANARVALASTVQGQIDRMLEKAHAFESMGNDFVGIVAALSAEWDSLVNGSGGLPVQ